MHSNPTHIFDFNPLYKELFLKKEQVIPHVGIRYGSEVAKHDIDLNDIAEQNLLDVPPWTPHSPTISYDLASDKKASTDSIVFKTK